MAWRGPLRDRVLAGCVVGVALLVLAAYVFAGLRPVDTPAASREVTLRIPAGAGLADIAHLLDSVGVLRSPFVFQLVALLRGDAGELQAGSYLFRTDEGALAILRKLTGGAAREVSVTIPEGATFYDIDAILAERGVLVPGAFIAYVSSRGDAIEGKLFPDTYRFFTDAPPEDVARRMTDTFAEKAAPLFAKSKNPNRDLTLASLLEREVPAYEDRRVVAGVLLKRVAAGMPLQVDATVCYAKEIVAGRAVDCLPLTPLDFQIESPYNTYLQRGWPPGPIGNPGLAALEAALRPVPSSYWYYLSDPATQRTIFSTTFDEHRANKAKYLRP